MSRLAPRSYLAAIPLLLLLLFAAAICLPGLLSRAISYDEAITLLEVAGKAYPDGRAASEVVVGAPGIGVPGWPRTPQPVGKFKPWFHEDASLSDIAAQLRRADVHPPLYYWTLSFWRQVFGRSLEAARALSLVCSLASVVLLYWLCVAGGVRYPLIPSLTFALASSTADQAQQARAYSMAIMLVWGAALVAVLLWKHPPKRPRNRFFCFTAFGLLSAASFLTNYLAAIPAGAIILWLAVVMKRGRTAFLMIVAGVACVTVLPWAPALADHIRARPDQFAGFPGFVVGVAFQINIYAHMLLNPAQIGQAGSLAFVIGIAAAACLGAVALLRTESVEEPRFLTLLWALALAPVAAILALNILFDKHLIQARYFVYALPAFAVLLTYKLGQFRQPIQSLAFVAATALWISQLICANRGYETTAGVRTAHYRSLAKTVESVGTDSAVLVAGIEYGVAVPGSLVYELPASLSVIFLRVDSDPVEVASMLDRYENVWQAYAGGLTGPVENAVAERLLELGRTPEPAPDAVLFRRQAKQHE